MMDRAVLRRLAKGAGVVLTLAALAFVFREILRSDLSSWRLINSPGGVATLVGIGVLYGMALTLIYFAWLALLGPESKKVPTDKLVAMYGRFQIYKYIPSNVVHQVTRYAFLKDGGVTHKSIIWSTLSETGLVIVVAVGVGVVFGGAGLASGLVELPAGLLRWGLIAGLALMALTLVASIVMRHRVASVISFFRNRLIGVTVAGGLYAAFFVATGILLYWMLAETAAPDKVLPPLGLVIAANALAWVVGTVTPGAPGGMGVREFVLIASLAPFGVESAAVALAAQYRLATVIGDLTFFIGAKSGAALLRRWAALL